MRSGEGEARVRSSFPLNQHDAPERASSRSSGFALCVYPASEQLLRNTKEFELFVFRSVQFPRLLKLVRVKVRNRPVKTLFFQEFKGFVLKCSDSDDWAHGLAPTGH